MVPSAQLYQKYLSDPNVHDQLDLQRGLKSKSRLLWQTKQNLDYLCLMTYGRRLGRYYMVLHTCLSSSPSSLLSSSVTITTATVITIFTAVRKTQQMEDDIKTKRGYLSAIKRHVADSSRPEFVMWEFSIYGFYGKLFRSTDLPILIDYMGSRYREEACDILMDDCFKELY